LVHQLGIQLHTNPIESDSFLLFRIDLLMVLIKVQDNHQLMFEDLQPLFQRQIHQQQSLKTELLIIFKK
jgi:hypothetical protein